MTDPHLILPLDAKTDSPIVAHEAAPEEPSVAAGHGDIADGMLNGSNALVDKVYVTVSTTNDEPKRSSIPFAGRIEPEFWEPAAAEPDERILVDDSNDARINVANELDPEPSTKIVKTKTNSLEATSTNKQLIKSKRNFIKGFLATFRSKNKMNNKNAIKGLQANKCGSAPEFAAQIEKDEAPETGAPSVSEAAAIKGLHATRCVSTQGLAVETEKDEAPAVPVTTAPTVVMTATIKGIQATTPSKCVLTPECPAEIEKDAAPAVIKTETPTVTATTTEEAPAKATEHEEAANEQERKETTTDMEDLEKSPAGREKGEEALVKVEEEKKALTKTEENKEAPTTAPSTESLTHCPREFDMLLSSIDIPSVVSRTSSFTSVVAGPSSFTSTSTEASSPSSPFSVSSSCSPISTEATNALSAQASRDPSLPEEIKPEFEKPAAEPNERNLVDDSNHARSEVEEELHVSDASESDPEPSTKIVETKTNSLQVTGKNKQLIKWRRNYVKELLASFRNKNKMNRKEIMKGSNAKKCVSTPAVIDEIEKNAAPAVIKAEPPTVIVTLTEEAPAKATENEEAAKEQERKESTTHLKDLEKPREKGKTTPVKLKAKKKARTNKTEKNKLPPSTESLTFCARNFIMLLSSIESGTSSLFTFVVEGSSSFTSTSTGASSSSFSSGASSCTSISAKAKNDLSAQASQDPFLQEELAAIFKRIEKDKEDTTDTDEQVESPHQKRCCGFEVFWDELVHFLPCTRCECKACTSTAGHAVNRPKLEEKEVRDAGYKELLINGTAEGIDDAEERSSILSHPEDQESRSHVDEEPEKTITASFCGSARSLPTEIVTVSTADGPDNHEPSRLCTGDERECIDVRDPEASYSTTTSFTISSSISPSFDTSCTSHQGVNRANSVRSRFSKAASIFSRKSRNSATASMKPTVNVEETVNMSRAASRASCKSCSSNKGAKESKMQEETENVSQAASRLSQKSRRSNKSARKPQATGKVKEDSPGSKTLLSKVGLPPLSPKHSESRRDDNDVFEEHNAADVSNSSCFERVPSKVEVPTVSASCE